MKALLVVLPLFALAAHAQNQVVNQATVINTVPGTQMVDSSEVKLPDACEYRGPISRNSPIYAFNAAKAAMKNLRKAAAAVNANVIVVTLLNLNSGIPMAGIGYHCSDLKEVKPSIKVFIVPPG